MDDLSFALLRSLSGKTDITDVPCPLCAGAATTNAGRKRECLRIWDAGEDFISFTCARCLVSGYAKPDDGSVTSTAPKVEKKPVAKEDKGPFCNFLWDKSLPAIGSLAQVYLQSRACWPDHAPANIRFMPASERNGRHYPPTMIARFGFAGEPLTGIHLTKLRTDGQGKAGTDTDKRTMGDTIGQPIVLHTNADATEIVIAEGIEDTSSLVIATGWTGWAAGTAGRIPAVVATAVQRGYKKIYVAKDLNNKNMVTQQVGASTRALEQAAAIARVIPLRFGTPFNKGSADADANTFLRQHGKLKTKAMIDWCEAHWIKSQDVSIAAIRKCDKAWADLKKAFAAVP